MGNLEKLVSKYVIIRVIKDVLIINLRFAVETLHVSDKYVLISF